MQLLASWWEYKGLLDWILVGWGCGLVIVQLRVALHVRRSKRTLSGNEEKLVLLVNRVSVLSIDIFPMLGLLGTVVALLNTFAGIRGQTISTNVIATFAPGLTTTVSGLGAALVNLFVYTLCLSPIVPGKSGRDENG